VGGLVRDLCLQRELREPLDLDVVVEGDGLNLAQQLASELGGRLVSHPRFLTSTVILPDGVEIDVATARTETYPVSGSLPVVQPGTLRQDLFRRDFSINSLAAPITPAGLGEVLDLTEGLSDLREGRVRVLHAGSFVDDPTRLFRAVRFEQRLGFHMEAKTLRLAESAILRETLANISRERVRNELILVCQERESLAGLRRLQALGVLAQLGFSSRWSRRREAFMADLASSALESALTQRRALIELYRLDVDATANWPSLLWALSRPDLSNSRLYALLRPLRPDELEVLGARAAPYPNVRQRLDRFLTQLAGAKPLLKGQHLIARGVCPGPELGRVLQESFAAQLDRGWSDLVHALEWLQALPGDKPKKS
jgi:tRNA nucleotidyltransferase (CCA-adding enzyme)